LSSLSAGLRSENRSSCNVTRDRVSVIDRGGKDKGKGINLIVAA
jgi:hypothetical protein